MRSARGMEEFDVWLRECYFLGYHRLSVSTLKTAEFSKVKVRIRLLTDFAWEYERSARLGMFWRLYWFHNQLRSFITEQRDRWGHTRSSSSPNRAGVNRKSSNPAKARYGSSLASSHRSDMVRQARCKGETRLSHHAATRVKASLEGILTSAGPDNRTCCGVALCSGPASRKPSFPKPTPRPPHRPTRWPSPRSVSCRCIAQCHILTTPLVKPYQPQPEQEGPPERHQAAGGAPFTVAEGREYTLRMLHVPVN